MSLDLGLDARLDRIKAVRGLIRRRSYWSGGLGLIPFPLIDVAAITAVQVKMLMDIAKNYPIESNGNRARTAVSALVAGVLPVALGGSVISAFKFVPGIGQVAGVLAVPALAAASTIAIGRVFLEHFESGGTLLDFDPEEMRAYFMSEFAAAKANLAGAVDAPLGAKPSVNDAPDGAFESAVAAQ